MLFHQLPHQITPSFTIYVLYLSLKRQKDRETINHRNEPLEMPLMMEDKT